MTQQEGSVEQAEEAKRALLRWQKAEPLLRRIEQLLPAFIMVHDYGPESIPVSWLNEIRAVLADEQ